MVWWMNMFEVVVKVGQRSSQPNVLFFEHTYRELIVFTFLA